MYYRHFMALIAPVNNKAIQRALQRHALPSQLYYASTPVTAAAGGIKISYNRRIKTTVQLQCAAR